MSSGALPPTETSGRSCRAGVNEGSTSLTPTSLWLWVAPLGEREHVQRVGRLLRPSEGKRARFMSLLREIPLKSFRRDGDARALLSADPAQL